MIIKSPAKLNLFLNITKKRSDGYHDIETYFQLINLYDEISLKINEASDISFNSNNSELNTNDNLCVKAAEILRSHVKSKKNLSALIELKKNIPVGGGLGGGSSNAAMVLLGLNNLWKCNLPKEQLNSLGEKLGADVPLFINGFSAYGKGKGNILIKHQIKKNFFLVIYPGINVSSKDMYQGYKINDCIKHINIDNMHQNLGFNSFENLLCSKYQDIKELLEILRNYNNGAVSGSGSCVFSIFDDEATAIKISKLVPKKYQTYIVHSLNTI